MIVTTDASANALGGWARAIAAASGRSRYRARCAQASAGAPAGSVPAGSVRAGWAPAGWAPAGWAAAASGTSITRAAVTPARSAAGVISIDAPARADTCP